MRMRNTAISMVGGVALAVLALAALGLSGCDEGNKAGAPAPKGAQAQAEYANVRCPIMNSPIDPAKVMPDLTRTYKGQEVAFCCAGCPATWDKLTEVEKDAKLAAVRKPADPPTP